MPPVFFLWKPNLVFDDSPSPGMATGLLSRYSVIEHPHSAVLDDSLLSSTYLFHSKGAHSRLVLRYCVLDDGRLSSTT